MGWDTQGVFRGSCSICDCTDYTRNTNISSQKCSYCGHYPSHHWEGGVREAETGEQETGGQETGQPETGQQVTGQPDTGDPESLEHASLEQHIPTRRWVPWIISSLYYLLFYIGVRGVIFLVEWVYCAVTWLIRQSLSPLRFSLLVYIVVRPVRSYINMHCELREYPHPLATMLVFLFTSILLLGLLYTYTAGVHPIHYYTAWARIAITLTATFLLLFHWADTVYNMLLTEDKYTHPYQMLETLIEEFIDILLTFIDFLRPVEKHLNTS